MTKYIIKNCPARVLFTDGYFCRQADGNILCSDCTACVMKQIVELCKDSIKENERNIYRAGRMSLAINILDKLDIQEVE